MYIYCDECGNSFHISEWNRIGKYSFSCPKCGMIKDLRNYIEKAFSLEKEV